MAEDVVGLRYVSEGLDEVLRGIKRYHTALGQTGGSARQATRAQQASAQATRVKTQAVQSATQAEREHAASEKAKLTALGRTIVMQRRSGQVAQQSLQREVSAVRNAMAVRERAARAEAQSLRAMGAQAQRRIQLRERSARAATTAANREAAAVQRQVREQARLARSTATTAVATTGAMTAQMRLRQSFLQTANSIAILDGPLGGIASRFSAFGVLIGRTGLLLAGALVAVTSLTVVIGRGVSAFTQFEAQTARINAMLEATGRAASMSAQDIERMSARIALATLESEEGVRQAALRLASFRDIATDMFEDILRAAADMSAAGFGTMESEAVRLAKALEDPRQALTSLSRAGIVFTRQQRAMAISLVESGDRLRAMEMILEHVNRRVGGTAEAAARETFAGAFDTIQQAAGRAMRALGEFALTQTVLGSTVLGTAAALEDYARGQGATEEQARAALVQAERYEAHMQRLQDILTENTRLRASQIAQIQEEIAATQARADAAREYAASLTDQAAAEQAVTRLAQLRRQNERRGEGIENLRAEAQLRRRMVGYTEEEARVRRMMADEGILGIDVAASVAEYARALADAGAGTNAIRVAVERLERDLRHAAAAGADLTATLREERDVRDAMRVSEGLTQQITLLRAQLGYMRQGVAAAQARQRAEDDVTRALLDSALASQNLPVETRRALQEARALLDTVRNLTGEIDASAAAAGRLSSALSAAANVGLGLGDRLAGMQARLTALRSGADQYTASAREGLVLEQRRLQEVLRSGSLVQRGQAAMQLAITRDRLEQIAALEREEAAIRASNRGGGGGGAGSAGEVQTLESIVQRLQRRIAREQELLTLSREQRAERETYFDLIDQLEAAEVTFSEQRVRDIAATIAAEEERTRILEEQNRVARNVATSFSQMFTDAITGAESLNDSLKKLLGSLSQMFFNQAFMQLLEGPLMGLIGGAAVPGGGSPRANAAGTNSFIGGMTRINERGGEIAVLPSGSKVIPHSLSRGMAGGGTSVVVNNYTGAPVQEQRSTGPDGRELVEVTVGQAIAKGRFDRQMGGRYGQTPQRISR